MPKLSRVLLSLSALAGFSVLGVAQTGPQLTVSPGLIYTVASRASNNLTFSSFNGVAFNRNLGTLGTVYVADAHSETKGSGLIFLANVYAIDLASGQVTRVAGTVPDHTNGNIPTPQPPPGQQTPQDCYIQNNSAGPCPGDGGPATSAQLHEPSGLALDSAGNLFIADARENVIRRVDKNTQTISTIAGTGATGVGCNSCAATQANLSFPTGLAFDGAGNLYFADTLNNRVRVITSGTISTVAGTTAAGFGGDGGPATAAQLNQPYGVAIDASGNLFIADTKNHAIREVTGGNISTVAGQGTVAGYTGDGGAATSATLRTPYNVAVDAGGNLFIADTNNSAIRKVTGDASHIISTIAGNGTAGYSGDGGAALKALLNNPAFMTIDGQNNLYFTDNNLAAVRKITATAAPLTLPLTAVGSTATSSFPLTISNTGNQTLNISAVNFPSNFTAGPGVGNACLPGSFSLSPGASCNLSVNFSPTSGGSTSGTLSIVSNAVNQTNGTANVTLSESNGLYFVPVAPCRVIDTRLSDPTFGGGVYTAGQTRTYAIRNSNAVGCSSAPVPASADVQAYSLNVTVVPQNRQTLRFLTVYPGDPSGNNRPNVSTLNSFDGRIKANAAIIPANTGDANRSISIYASDPTDVIVDINGYYVPEATLASTTNGQTPLAYYPLPPCRAVDTRPNTGLLGQNTPLLGGQSADYALANVCSLPTNAQAYALNYTAVPVNGVPIRFLTTWPTNPAIPRPVVSTLNVPTGTVTANAAIVPVGTNGSVSVFSTDDTNLIIDVAGYYAPPTTGGLALYNVTPCRAFDSRNSGSSPLAGGVTASQNIASGGNCSVPATAQSYVLNATVLPTSSLAYLTAWNQGSAQPVQSVLNANDAQVTSNLAVVPTVNGFVSTYASSSTGLILDLSAYFAP